MRVKCDFDLTSPRRSVRNGQDPKWSLSRPLMFKFSVDISMSAAVYWPSPTKSLATSGLSDITRQRSLTCSILFQSQPLAEAKGQSCCVIVKIYMLAVRYVLLRPHQVKGNLRVRELITARSPQVGPMLHRARHLCFLRRSAVMRSEWLDDMGFVCI